MSIFTTTETFTVVTCCHEGCGVQFAFTDGYERRRREDHEWFYCPNGHRQHYSGDNEAERLRKDVIRKQATIDQLDASRVAAWKSAESEKRKAAAARGQTTKIRKRVAHGICPCCQRTFKQLAAHMADKHPEYATVTEAE